MATKKERFKLPGSQHPPLPGRREAGRPDPGERVEVTVYLRHRSPGPLPDPGEAGHRHLTHAELEGFHGAHPDDVERVAAFAREHGLTVVEASAAKRTVRLAGTIEELEHAFDVCLVHYHHQDGTHRGHDGHLHLPAELQEVVTSVLGLDDRPVARPHLPAPASSAATEGLAAGAAKMLASRPGTFTPAQVAAAYAFPPDLDGEGQTIALIELGGGYHRGDLEEYFGGLGIESPEVVSCGPNRPSTAAEPSSYDAEVALDIDVAGALAPKARIVVYFAEHNTTQAFVDVVNEAVQDRENAPSVISISWGSSETEWAESAAREMARVIQTAGLLGITVCVSSGDYGAPNGLAEGVVVNFPASAPFALACGGTRLTAPGDVYGSEAAWNNLKQGGGATGGGVSVLFPRPGYQETAGVPTVPAAGTRAGFAGRGVPDVAGDADSFTGYLIMIYGQWLTSGGTSAVAPLWAALVARCNQRLGRRLGFLNRSLYALEGSDAFHPITEGDNGFYSCGPGWNACTGLGTPDGIRLLERLGTSD